jgi:superfamily I DNA/RNA helicase
LKTVTDAATAGEAHRTLFIAHSDPTRRAIENLFAINGGEDFLEAEVALLTKPQSIKVTTLQELCANLLKREISESELVDRDAYEAKLVQRLYAIEGVERALRDEYDSHAPFLSESFRKLMTETEHWAIAEMLQHEISVQIKGRADQDLSKYKKLERLKIGLPVENEGDKTFAFLMYQKYQGELEMAAQFDTDDVVLSAISQLNTPIWRRRRAREGFNSIFVDETHLFNVNELSVFHRLTKNELSQPIAYSVDRSQALGDRGWTDLSFDAAFDPSGTLGQSDPTRIRSVFRCSPEIVDLAFSVTSSGATLFTNFHNPLTASMSAFTAEEERKSKKPVYLKFPSDDAMLEAAFGRADALAREMDVLKADVAVIVFGDELFARAQESAKSHRKPVEVVKSRGDLEAVNRARMSGRFVLTAPEFVGGLEFAGVVLVGVDGGRVPPKGAGLDFEPSQNFLTYAAHQRLYVAITRARFRIEILGNEARGISDILRSGVAAGLLDCTNV